MRNFFFVLCFFKILFLVAQIDDSKNAFNLILLHAIKASNFLKYPSQRGKTLGIFLPFISWTLEPTRALKNSRDPTPLSPTCT